MTNKSLLIYRIVSSILLAAILVTIFCLSAENADESKETSVAVTSWLSGIFGDIPDDIVRTIAHGCEFAALGFFMHNMIYSFKTSISPFLSTGLSCIYAISDEIHQIFVPGRAFQFVDIAVDFTGIAIGTTAIVTIIKIIEKKHKNKTCDS